MRRLNSNQKTIDTRDRLKERFRQFQEVLRLQRKTMNERPRKVFFLNQKRVDLGFVLLAMTGQCLSRHPEALT